MRDVREKLVELLGNLFCGDYGINGCDSCKYNTEVMCSAHACADHLIANGVTIQRWIPVEEQVPEEMKNVLAYTAVGSFAETAHWTGYRWEKTWDFEVLYGVSHWMPLPQPPKEVD